MEREVFVLMKNHQFDCGDYGLECIGVYDTFDKATEVFKAECDKAALEMLAQVGDVETDVYEEGDMSWSAWEKGEYAYNHIDLVIEQKTIIEEV